MVSTRYQPHNALESLSARYQSLYDLIDGEVVGLTDDELDWESDWWECFQWSMRRNLSHVANTFFKVIMYWWVDQIWPEGDVPEIPDFEYIAPSPTIATWTSISIGAKNLKRPTYGPQTQLRMTGCPVAHMC